MAKKKAMIHISKEFVAEVRQIIDNGRHQAFSTASAISLATYWNIGRRIVEEERAHPGRIWISSYCRIGTGSNT